MNKKIIILPILVNFLLTGCVGRIVNYDDSPKIKQNSIIKETKEVIKSPLGYKSFIKKQNPKLDEEKISYLSYFITRYSKENNLDTRLVLSLMARESSFRADVVSPSGAVGLGQLLPSTAKDMGVDDPFNPEENAKATTKYIAWLLKKWNGDVDKTLASYKIGLGTVGNLLKAGKEYPEDTKSYIQDIKNYRDKIAEE